jgi:hypothetical protein
VNRGGKNRSEVFEVAEKGKEVASGIRRLLLRQ